MCFVDPFDVLTRTLKIVRLAEEAAMTIARQLPPDVCLQVLGPLLRDAEFPVNLAAIKMITKVISV